jgi:hypothetical protein
LEKHWKNSVPSVFFEKKIGKTLEKYKLPVQFFIRIQEEYYIFPRVSPHNDIIAIYDM